MIKIILVVLVTLSLNAMTVSNVKKYDAFICSWDYTGSQITGEYIDRFVIVERKSVSFMINLDTRNAFAMTRCEGITRTIGYRKETR